MTYQDTVLATQSANLLAYWPLAETSGTSAADVSGNGRNGTYAGVTLGGAGIGDGGTAPTFDGTTSQVSIWSTGLRDAFNGQLGSASLWLRVGVENRTEWTDLATRYALLLSNGANYWIAATRGNANWTCGIGRKCGATTSPYFSQAFSYQMGGCLDGWIHLGLTWNKTLDRGSGFLDGMQTAYTTIADWDSATPLAAASTYIGGDGASGFIGQIAHVALWDTELTAAEMRHLSTVNPPRWRLVVIGDSIAGFWVNFMTDQYNGIMFNHAEGGSTINDNADVSKSMGGQADAAASDNADFVIVALGTNDGLPLATLQPIYVANLNQLLSQHPDACIYCQQVLRKNGGSMYDSVGAQTVRAAVAQVANPRVWTTDCDLWIDGISSVTGDPWLDGDLIVADIVHPNPVGAQKIVTQLLAALAAAPTFPPAATRAEQAGWRGVLAERAACGRVV